MEHEMYEVLICDVIFYFDQIKTQLQSRSGAPIAVGHQHNVSGFCDAFYKIYSRHGFRGLWRGATGSMMRVTVGSSVQLPTFSKVKCLMDQYQVCISAAYIFQNLKPAFQNNRSFPVTLS